VKVIRNPHIATDQFAVWTRTADAVLERLGV
jgi:hypothetical protein